MSAFRKSEIAGIFSRWLERYSPPAAIRENSRAQQDEVESLLGVLLRFAPHSDYTGWIARVLDRLEYQMKTRAWPTKGEVGAVCSNLSKAAATSAPGAVTWSLDPADVAARRMQRGEAVGEGWIWGVGAVELAARRSIDAETMGRYRSAAFFARRDAYGEAEALRWEVEQKAAHEASKTVWRERESERSAKTATLPDKRVVDARR